MIPIYRAKKIDGDEYVEGFYLPNHVIGDYESEDEDEREEWTEDYIISGLSQDTWEEDESYYNHNSMFQIDPTTLAIHFPDMIDSQGNKIFASLSETGKGGDILYAFGYGESIPFYCNKGIRYIGYENHREVADFSEEKVIGIQQ